MTAPSFTDLPLWQRGTPRQRADIEVVWRRTEGIQSLAVRQCFASLAPLTEALNRDMASLSARLRDARRRHHL